jgi:hypothetical protein
LDRVIVYTTELPRSVDFLTAEKNKLYAQGYQNAAMLGTGTNVAGLVAAPTSPASLQITVGTGSIYESETVDATAYSTLGTDPNTVVKQGILLAPVTLSITPPSTAGYSQVYLVEAIYNDVDAGVTTLPYYNSANPLQPFSGPNNNGLGQYTLRTGVCAVALKAGTAAPTGSQLTPSADAGYVGLYTITVANGQTTITSGQIIQLNYAPFFPTLPAVPTDIQNGIWVSADDTGTTNAMVVTLTPAATSYLKYMGLRCKVANYNTGSTTINVNGLGNKNITRGDGTTLQAGDLQAGEIVTLVYDGTNFQLVDISGAIAPKRNVVIFGTPGTTTWTCPAGVGLVECICQGAGASGSNGSGSDGAGGGGSGSSTWGYYPVIPGTVYNVVVGAGGGPITTLNSYGSTGGSSSFGSFTSAPGAPNVNYQSGSINATGGPPGGFPYVVIQTATIQASGSGYVNGDTINLSCGGQVTWHTGGVLTVTNVGGLSSMQVIPTNPVTQNTTSGSGTGITVNLTWGASGAATQPTGGLINLPGSWGHDGNPSSAGVSGGDGGGTQFGGGGRAGTPNGEGAATWGGGGGGSYGTSPISSGGGAGGVVILKY